MRKIFITALMLMTTLFASAQDYMIFTMADGSQRYVSDDDIENIIISQQKACMVHPLFLVGFDIGDGNWNIAPDAIGTSMIPTYPVSSTEFVYTGYFAGKGFKMIRVPGNWNSQYGYNGTYNGVAEFFGADGYYMDNIILSAGYYTVKGQANDISNTMTNEASGTVTAYTLDAATYSAAKLVAGGKSYDMKAVNSTNNHDWFVELDNVADISGAYFTLTNDSNVSKSHYVSDFPYGLSVDGTGIYGDVNGDGNVDINDVNAIISVICGGDANDLADINGDGNTDINDVNSVIAVICGDTSNATATTTIPAGTWKVFYNDILNRFIFYNEDYAEQLAKQYYDGDPQTISLIGDKTIDLNNETDSVTIFEPQCSFMTSSSDLYASYYKVTCGDVSTYIPNNGKLSYSNFYDNFVASFFGRLRNDTTVTLNISKTVYNAATKIEYSAATTLTIKAKESDKTFEPADPILWFLVGDNILNGYWSDQPGVSSVPLFLDSTCGYDEGTGTGMVTYENYITSDGFKLQPADYNWEYGFMYGGTNVAEYRNGNGDNGNIWISPAGIYRLTVNTRVNTCDISYVSSTSTVYSSVKVVGDFDGDNWNGVAMTSVNKSGENHVWIYTATVSSASGAQLLFEKDGTLYGLTENSGKVTTCGIVSKGNSATIGLAQGSWIICYNDITDEYSIISATDYNKNVIR